MAPASCTHFTLIGACWAGGSTRVRAMLIDAGHIGREFSPSVRLVLGPAIRAHMPRWEDATKDEYHPSVPGEQRRKKDFVPFTTSAYQLRRIIAGAKAANESFRIKYTARARGALFVLAFVVGCPRRRQQHTNPSASIHGTYLRLFLCFTQVAGAGMGSNPLD